MAADTQVASFHGASPGTPADVTDQTIRFKRADDDAQDALDIVPVPSSGFAYSWRKSLKLRVATVGPDNVLSNLRFFSELQSLGTDKTLLARTAASYTQGSPADEDTALPGAVDVDNFTSGSPLVVNAGTVFGAGETGDGTQDFVELQARLGPNAASGNVAEAKGLRYRYDEA